MRLNFKEEGKKERKIKRYEKERRLEEEEKLWKKQEHLRRKVGKEKEGREAR